MPELTIQEAFDLAIQHHQAGRLNEAEQVYRLILARQPEHADALHLSGVIAAQTGRLDVAIDLIRRAIILRNDWPQAYNNLGKVLRDAGQLNEAVTAFRQVVALMPDRAEAHYVLGNALRATGRMEEAIAAWRQAAVLKSNYFQAYLNLGAALNEIGQPDEAIAACRQALAMNPNSPEAATNLGNALRATGQIDQAIAAYRQVLAIKPNYAEAHFNLGNALHDNGQMDESIAAYRQAVAAKPNFADAYVNLGNALRDKGSLDEAIAAYRQVLALKPNFAEVHNNLGIALRDKGNLDEAIAAYRQAIALKPDYPEAHNNLGIALKGQGLLGEAIADYRQALAIDPDYVKAHSNLVYAIHFHPGYDAKAIATEHGQWNRQHAAPLQKYIQPYANDRNPARRLKIGYVSPDFRDHVVGLFLLPLLANHDHQAVEVFAYTPVTAADNLTQQLRRHIDTWRSLTNLSDAQAADLIRQDGIDILVDLTLHMANNRLLIFARKPAPVQVTYLAYAGSSGLATMDYRLSDPYLDPPETDESVYSEQTIRLPQTYWCYQPLLNPPLQPPPAVEKGFITFGCLNNFCKVNEPLLDLWARLLGAVPHSRLLLHAQEGSHRQRVLDHVQRHGIAPERVAFAGSVPLAAYFAQYQSIDIALDTHPYGGGTTTCDALWMGVPVISLAGNTAVGRGGLSILSNIGLPKLVAHSPEQYVQIAADLANDLPRLTQLRATLRQRMQQSPLMDGPRFARNVEAAYRQMWQKWCAAATI